MELGELIFTGLETVGLVPVPLVAVVFYIWFTSRAQSNREASKDATINTLLLEASAERVKYLATIQEHAKLANKYTDKIDNLETRQAHLENELAEERKMREALEVKVTSLEAENKDLKLRLQEEIDKRREAEKRSQERTKELENVRAELNQLKKQQEKSA